MSTGQGLRKTQIVFRIAEYLEIYRIWTGGPPLHRKETMIYNWRRMLGNRCALYKQLNLVSDGVSMRLSARES